ncbi:hypothetical protein K474DRAFT_1345248 [Panus rudis PR-1116 ss-1]|nr:hypothetical protein K474DRAFT_1345248 [Panus rudis PR-1116 ss-1]
MASTPLVATVSFPILVLFDCRLISFFFLVLMLNLVQIARGKTQKTLGKQRSKTASWSLEAAIQFNLCIFSARSRSCAASTSASSRSYRKSTYSFAVS